MSEKELIESYMEEILKNISKENLERWNNKNNNKEELKEYFEEEKSEYEKYAKKHCCKCKNKEEDCKITKNTEGKCQCGEFKE